MKNEYFWILIFISLIVFLQAGIRPLLLKREAKQALEKVLTNFQSGDFTLNANHWINPQTIPPIVKIENYEILNSKFLEKNRQRQAFYSIVLNFGKKSYLPSGQIWKISLKETADGWKVESFQPQNKL